MPLLPPPSGVTPERVFEAEAIIAGALGCSGLEEREVIEGGAIGDSGIIHLKDGPAVSLVALTLNGLSATSLLTTPWTVDVSSLVKPHTFWTERFGYSHDSVFRSLVGAPYTVTYKAGWTGANLPEQVKQAITMLASRLHTASLTSGIKSETMGPVKRDFVTGEATGLPDAILAMLRPWTPLRV